MAYPHFQPAQPHALRILNRKYNKLDQTKWSSAKSLTRELKTSAWKLAFKYGKSSTIHGMNRLLGESSSKYERYIWLLSILLAFLGSIYVGLILSKRFTDGQFETVVDSTRMPVYRIYFPVVTICNLNRLNWQRLEEAKARFLPDEKSTEKLQLFERVVGVYDDIRFANFDKFSVLEGEPLEQLNHVNFSLVVDFMTWRCEEMVTQCVWNYFPINCCEVFSKRRTQSGLCWSFNTMETEEGRRMKRLDPMWPWHTGGAGPTSGLNVRVLINPDKHYPKGRNDKGISVMITEPLVWHKDAFTVPENTKTLVEVEPIIYFYDNNTRGTSSEERQCVFDDERNSRDFKSLHGYIYMIENCQAQCHQEYLVRFCNCTVDLLFPPGPYRSCRSADLLCLAKHNDFFLYSHQPGEEEYVSNPYEGMICKCFRNCYSLNYIADVRPSYLPAEVRGNLSYVDLNVHFRFETMMVYRTSLVFGWVDLMVAFGGIAGLFLGCSLISAMELVYFTVIELPNFVFKEVRTTWHSRRAGEDKIRKFGLSNRIMAQNQHKDYDTKAQRHHQFSHGTAPWNHFVTKNVTKSYF